LAKLGIPNVERQANAEYKVYRQLCWAKHSNPVLQKLHGYHTQPQKVTAQNGPDLSENAIRESWFALEHGAALAFIALCSFARNHVEPEPRASLLQEIQKIGERRKALEAKAKARWGTNDPFPGRW
jgi:hypothetical protein